MDGEKRILAAINTMQEDINKRFEIVDERLGTMQEDINKRFEIVDERLDTMQEDIKELKINQIIIKKDVSDLKISNDATVFEFSNLVKLVGNLNEQINKKHDNFEKDVNKRIEFLEKKVKLA